MSADVLKLYAPLSGILVPLESVPDPVFAQKMVGDGVSIDPSSSELLAPVAGTVTMIHKSSHALTLTTDDGVEVLIHVGLDTVTLRGEGFRSLVETGARVKLGQALLRFDPVLVGRKAVSLLTQVLIANGDKVQALQPAAGPVEAGQSVILTYRLADGGAVPTAAGGATVTSPEVTLPNHSGLHARPAAVLVTEAKKFQSEIRLQMGSQSVNARSLTAILGLGTRQGDRLRVQAQGTDAAEAAAGLARLLASGSGEDLSVAPPSAAPLDGVGPIHKGRVRGLQGVPASPGVAVGPVWHLRPEPVAASGANLGKAGELALYENALLDVRTELEQLMHNLGPGSGSRILEAHLELLQDPELREPTLADLGVGSNAADAWSHSCAAAAARLEKSAVPLLRERAHDVRDVQRRVLLAMAGGRQKTPTAPGDCILVTEELSPSEAAQLDPARILGLCTTHGGATGHVAILARSLGIPAVCGAEAGVLSLEAGSTVILDGSAGALVPDPSPAELDAARARRARDRSRQAKDAGQAHLSVKTRDGVAVEVAANITNAADAKAAVAAGADGVGLMRTEFLFNDRAEAPSEAEQAAEYQAVAQALGKDRKLVIRTLDAGGDKPLAFVPLPKEDNPFLGVRGIRIGLRQPELLRRQLRAILSAAGDCDLHIMVPMITDVAELWQVKGILAEESKATGRGAKLGVMIEVPSAALCADRLAKDADFFSIGSNDLTQYTLAMDRGNPALARQADALHPSVLKLISLTVEAAHRHGKWVGVCGGMASDPVSAAALLGLGVDELSCSVPAIPGIKALITRLDRGECQRLARESLELGSAAEVRARLAPLVDEEN
ncbi:MAG TPA: phosphoenolpyruvate--protein phosphotransferase [bacterium]|nr:phosphoenolpyruvate--protein phosphotransferase [bacterium]